MQNQPYKLGRPATVTSCAVFGAPHSGAEFPEGFLRKAILSKQVLRSSEDAFVDRLIDQVPGFGALAIAARFPRAFVDVNRAEGELDPALIRGVPRHNTSQRVAAGLGVIPRVVSGGRAIQRGKMALAEVESRLASCYRPYHRALAGLIGAQMLRFGMCLLLDIHSMPHDALQASEKAPAQRPDIVLGDLYGQSCDRWVSGAVQAAFVDAGFSVARNAPFAGGYITRHYGQPNRNIHAIQIEIDRALYMDEAKITPKPQFDLFKDRINTVFSVLAGLGPRIQEIAAE